MSSRIVKCALLAAVLSVTACAEVKESINEASAEIDDFFGVENSGNAAVPAKGDALYTEGIAARGRGDDKLAFSQFQQAAEMGHGPAAYELGLAYKDGHGTAKNLEVGANWINTAAERGEARAQYLIGLTYYDGSGVKQDYKIATGFLADAAVQGHPGAQHLLAQAFANGRGVTKNAAWAARWYGKAAAQGLVDAQFSYGVVHASGLGLPKSKVRGYTWLWLAAKAGHEKALEVSEVLEKNMTPTQLARAVSRAEDFKPVSGAPFTDPPTVMYVEHALNVLGFSAGPVDGILGKKSRAAIAAFQKSKGLSENGKLTRKFLRRLLKEQTAGG